MKLEFYCRFLWYTKGPRKQHPGK